MIPLPLLGAGIGTLGGMVFPQGKEALFAALAGTEGQKPPKTGSEFLRALGFPGSDVPVLGDVMGFGADVLGDPWTWAGGLGGLAGKLGGPTASRALGGMLSRSPVGPAAGLTPEATAFAKMIKEAPSLRRLTIADVEPLAALGPPRPPVNLLASPEGRSALWDASGRPEFQRLISELPRMNQHPLPSLFDARAAMLESPPQDLINAAMEALAMKQAARALPRMPAKGWGANEEIRNAVLEAMGLVPK